MTSINSATSLSNRPVRSMSSIATTSNSAGSFSLMASMPNPSSVSYAPPTATLTAEAVAPVQPAAIYTKQLSFDFGDMVAKKGTSGGVCQRASCETEGATYFNKSTHKYYCRYCARDINKNSEREALALYGVKSLCEPLTVE